MPRILQKVTAFVTRARASGAGGGYELLVMQHPTAGVQLPAGTVEENEPVVTAAFRELAEETGLIDVALVAQLGTEWFDCTERAALMFRTAPLRKGPNLNAPLLEAEFPRGYWCSVVDREGAFSQVVYEDLDLNVQPARVITRYSGWVESDAIAERVERHFFRFEPRGPTKERWVQLAEQRFECYWTPLAPKPALVGGQQGWLDGVYDALLSRGSPRESRS
jgi:ADP-ribose pyrophosphatase YjhB (NUDIX family)